MGQFVAQCDCVPLVAFVTGVSPANPMPTALFNCSLNHCRNCHATAPPSAPSYIYFLVRFCNVWRWRYEYENGFNEVSLNFCNNYEKARVMFRNGFFRYRPRKQWFTQSETNFEKNPTVDSGPTSNYRQSLGYRFMSGDIWPLWHFTAGHSRLTITGNKK